MQPLPRIGGADRFFHCDNCGFCLDNSMLETHRCRQDNSKNNCPVCMEVGVPCLHGGRCTLSAWR